MLVCDALAGIATLLGRFGPDVYGHGHLKGKSLRHAEERSGRSVSPRKMSFRKRLSFRKAYPSVSDTAWSSCLRSCSVWLAKCGMNLTGWFPDISGGSDLEQTEMCLSVVVLLC